MLKKSEKKLKNNFRKIKYKITNRKIFLKNCLKIK